MEARRAEPVGTSRSPPALSGQGPLAERRRAAAAGRRVQLVDPAAVLVRLQPDRLPVQLPVPPAPHRASGEGLAAAARHSRDGDRRSCPSSASHRLVEGAVPRGEGVPYARGVSWGDGRAPGPFGPRRCGGDHGQRLHPGGEDQLDPGVGARPVVSAPVRVGRSGEAWGLARIHGRPREGEPPDRAAGGAGVCVRSSGVGWRQQVDFGVGEAQAQAVGGDAALARPATTSNARPRPRATADEALDTDTGTRATGSL